jgi:predicted nicotinamide N-methyase
MAVATELARDPSMVQGKRVVELGCGLGLPGIVAGLSGAARVVMTDRSLTALRLVLTSANLNGLGTSGGFAMATDGGTQPGEKIKALGGPRMFAPAVSAGVMLEDDAGTGFETSAQQHREDDDSAEEKAAGGPELCVEQFCWETGVIQAAASAAAARAERRGGRSGALHTGCADVIIAADVLYSDEAVQPLARRIGQLLRPGGLLILADPAGEVIGIDAPVRGRAIELCKVLAKQCPTMRLVKVESATVSLDAGATTGDVDIIFATL